MSTLRSEDPRAGDFAEDAQEPVRRIGVRLLSEPGEISAETRAAVDDLAAKLGPTADGRLVHEKLDQTKQQRLLALFDIGDYVTYQLRAKALDGEFAAELLDVLMQLQKDILLRRIGATR